MLDDEDRQIIRNIVASELRDFAGRVVLYVLGVGAVGFLIWYVHEQHGKAVIGWFAASIFVLWVTISSLVELRNFRRNRLADYEVWGKPTRIGWLRDYGRDLNLTVVPGLSVLATAGAILVAYLWYTDQLSLLVVWKDEAAQWVKLLFANH